MIRHLKKLRVIVSLIFFLLTTVLFIDFKNYLPQVFYKDVLYLQFIPSVFKFFNILSLAASGFIVVILITLLFGRVYCSSICPLGTLQDVITYLSGRFKKKKRFKFLKPVSFLRYGILFISVVSILMGSMALIDLLDPYSNFGRIFSNLVRPVIVFLNNSAAYTMEKYKNYSLYPYDFRGIDPLIFILPVVFVTFVGWLAYTKGRLYCNSVCPVGALLGLLSKFSLFKVAIDKSNCKACGKCERVCKAGCIDNKSLSIDFTRCVGCYNCFNVCPSGGISYEFIKAKEIKITGQEINYSKRNFILSTSAYMLGLSTLSFAQQKIIKSTKKSTKPIFKKTPVTPPGSKGLKHFTGSCTACHLCVSACPTQVLQPAYLEYGMLGIMQPKMDYLKSFCNFECNLCSQVCPNGAILPLELEKKKTTQLGRVKFVKENCIVYTENTDCGACSEHCPTKAVNMVPYKGHPAPDVKEELCVGCGACEYACPVRPYKAIYVEGNPVHLTAKKPEVKKEKQKVDLKEDFPF